jgi:hypothetical protein
VTRVLSAGLLYRRIVSLSNGQLIPTFYLTWLADFSSDVIRKRFLEPSMKKIRNLVADEMEASPIPIQVSNERKVGLRHTMLTDQSMSY